MTDVTRSDLSQASTQRLAQGSFDLVILHDSLGGLPTLPAALQTAHRLLRVGGRVAVVGSNRMRRAPDSATRHIRATPWAYRSALRAAGFAEVTLCVIHPPGNAPVYLVEIKRRSAQGFFRAALRSRRLGRWSPVRALLTTLIDSHLMPYFQPGLLVLGDKC
jgi:SAM-dependent methyltransferase